MPRPAFTSMSIAVSTVVYPSRILCALIGVMALIAACIAIAIGVGSVGDVPSPIRWALSVPPFFLASFGFYHGMHARKTIQLDISGTGQIRLLKTGDKPPCVGINRTHVREIGELVRLTENSTLWPNMLLLRFRSEEGKVFVVPVLPDSVEREEFRALSVACRWISVQNDTQDANIF